MHAALSIALKDIRLLIRDRMGFFFTFFFPLLIAVFFGMVFRQGSGPAAIPVAVVDLDSTAESAAFAAKLQAEKERAEKTRRAPQGRNPPLPPIPRERTERSSLDPHGSAAGRQGASAQKNRSRIRATTCLPRSLA